jgi:hypothetical protein
VAHGNHHAAQHHGHSTNQASNATHAHVVRAAHHPHHARHRKPIVAEEQVSELDS